MIPRRWIEAYLRFLLRRRRAVALCVVLLTALFAHALTGLRVQPDFFDIYPANHSYIHFYQRFRAMFGSANVLSVILEVRRGDIYNPQTLQKLDRITRYMIYTKGVVPYQIASIAHPKVRTAVATGGSTISMREIFQAGVPQTPDEAERIRFRVYADPAVRGVYTATDDSAAVVHTSFWEEALDLDDLYARMVELRRLEEDANHRIHITGYPWLFASVQRYRGEIGWVFGFTLVALAFLLYAYFRTWAGIWVPLLSGLLSSVWGLGIAALLGFGLDPLVLVIPIFLTARALSHSVQSMARYHEELERLGDREKAIVASYSHLFAPAIAAIVTDGLTLLVVAVAPIPLIQKVAIFASFWIVSIFVSVVTLHPILLSVLRPPSTRRLRRRPDDGRVVGATLVLAAGVAAAAIATRAELVSGRGAALLLAPVLGWYWLRHAEGVYDSLTRAAVRCSSGRWRWAVLVAATSLLVVLPFWGWRLKVGDLTPGAALLFPEHPYNVASELLDRKFLGASQLVVMADSGVPDGVKDETVLRTVEALSYHMREAPGASVAFSIADVVKGAARLWRDGDPKWGTIPSHFREQTELLFVFELSGAGNVSQLVDRTSRYASVITLFHEHSHDVVMNAIDWARRFDPGGAVELLYAGGLFGILAAVNEAVERSYWINLGLVILIVYLCLYLTYRSWLASAILIVPVVLSQLAAEAFMVLARIDLNVNSLPVAAAGAGVGVDYGIYHFSRMIDAFRESGRLEEAVDHATRTTGKAILFTASTMVAGSIFWWFSDLKFLAEMGLLLALLMVFNTAGGLIVVPAFVKVLGPRVVTGAPARKAAPAPAPTPAG